MADDIFAPQGQRSGTFESHYLETEIDGERIGLTLWDSEGLEANVVDLQLREMSSFVEKKFEETFNEEMKVMRSPGVQDTHIHCTFLILDPARLDKNILTAKQAPQNGYSKTGRQSGSRMPGGLDEDLDLQVLRTLQGKTTIVPVISKADTITTAHMAYLKKTVSDSLRAANIDPLEALDLEDSEDLRDNDRLDEETEDEDADEGGDANGSSDSDGIIPTSKPPTPPNASPQSTSTSKRSSSIRHHKRTMSNEPLTPDEAPYLPLSIISPDMYDPGTIGRKFPWGFADPYQETHCDFVRLKEAVFSEWRSELREASRELWYEGWRTSRLKHRR